MYIVGAPTVEFKSRDIFHWCAHGRIQVQECILLVHPPLNASPEIYIAGAPIVGYESRDVYRWCAHCRTSV